MEYIKLNLRLFEGDGAAAGAAAGDGAGEGTVVNAPDDGVPDNPKRLKRNPLADVKYGIQPDSQGDTSAQKAAKEMTPDEEWKSLRDGKYKEQYGRDVQDAIQKRFKNAKANDDLLNTVRPALDALIKQRGLQEGDYAALSKAIMDDDSLYEEEALERGVSVDTLKEIKKLEADNERFRQQQQQSMEQQMFQQHLTMLGQEAEKLKQLYPGFDLNTELSNPKFARLTAPGSGIDLQTAFEAVHRDELQSGMMQAAINISQKKLANAIASGKSRPTEGGTRRSAAVDVRNDPTKLSRADREEIRNRVRRGELISW